MGVQRAPKERRRKNNSPVLLPDEGLFERGILFALEGFLTLLVYCDNIVYFVGRLVWIEFGPPAFLSQLLKFVFYLIFIYGISGVLR